MSLSYQNHHCIHQLMEIILDTFGSTNTRQVTEERVKDERYV